MNEQKQPIRSYRDLVVWQKSMDLVVLCHQLADQLPQSEKYGLCSQIRRAAGSIPANIAEGFGRHNRGDFVHHLWISNGSLKELETHIEVVVRLKFCARADVTKHVALCEEVGRMLLGLIRKLKAKS